MVERARKSDPDIPQTILDDPREIDGIYFNDRDGTRYTRSAGYVIEAYAETAPGAVIPFYRVLNKKGVLVARVPAWQVEVLYVTT